MARAGHAAGGLPGSPGAANPWGTGHAIWAARECVGEPMLVINADDFYGAAAYQAAADYFALADQLFRHRLLHGRHTACAIRSPPRCTVARGICCADAEALLHRGRRGGGDRKGMRRGKSQTTAADGRRQRFSGEEIVSMNMWGFTPAAVPPVGAAAGRVSSRPGWALRGRVLHSGGGRRPGPLPRRPRQGARRRRGGVDRR